MNSSPHAWKASGLSIESSPPSVAPTVLTAGVPRCQHPWGGAQNPSCRENTAWRWEVIVAQDLKPLSSHIPGWGKQRENRGGTQVWFHMWAEFAKNLCHGLQMLSPSQERRKSCLKGSLSGHPEVTMQVHSARGYTHEEHTLDCSKTSGTCNCSSFSTTASQWVKWAKL